MESSGNVSWKVVAEPEWPGCYAPGATVGTMRIEAAAGTDSLEGLSADVSRPLKLSSDYADGGRRWETRISVRGDAEPGTAKLEISYEEPGQFVSTADEPTRRDYTIDTNC